MKSSIKILCALLLAVTAVFAVASCDSNNDFGANCSNGKHTWSKGYVQVSAAACAKNATGYQICEVCETPGETAEIPGTALAHVWGREYTVATEAACATDATGYKTCVTCNAVGEPQKIVGTALEHVWSEEYTEDTAAACGINAKGYKTCTVCEAPGVLEEIEGTALEHDWSDTVVIVTDAACGVNAMGSNPCSRENCNAKNEPFAVEGTALEHAWSTDFVVDTAASCGVNAQGHKTCTACGAAGETAEVQGTALEHILSENYTKLTDATCQAKATGYKTCTRDGCSGQGVTESYGELGEHLWSETYTESTAATCTAKATGYKSCTVCQAPGERVEYGELAAHIWSEGYTGISAATCSAKATGYKTCTECQTAGETVEYGELTAHSFGVDYTDDASATCLSLPTHYLSCTVCGTPGESTEYGEFADHDYTGENIKDELKLENTDHDYYKSCKWCAAKDPSEATFIADCTYDMEIILSDNKASEATVSAPKQYYKSCICGKVSTTETFGVGYPAFAAGTGVYYKDSGDYVVAKKDWDTLTSSEYTSKNIAVSVSDSFGNIPTGTWGYTIFNNKLAPTGTQHIVETDIRINPVTFTKIENSGPNRFACLTITSAENGAQSNAFMQMYLHAWNDENGNQVIEITGDGYTSNANGYTVAILTPDDWYNLRFVITEIVDEQTSKTTAVKYDAYINGMLVCEGRTKGTNASLAINKLNGLGFEVRGNATTNIQIDNTVFGTYVEPLNLPEFVAGTGVYYTGTGVDLSTFTNKVAYNYDSGEITNYASGATSNDTANTNELKNGALYANHGSKWGHWYIKGSAATSDTHVFETDIMFTRGTISGTDMNFAWMGISGNWTGGNSKMATMFYLNAVSGNAAESGGKYIDAVKLEAHYDNAYHTAFTFETDEWYNLRLVAKRDAQTSKYYVDVYINGVLVQENFYVPAGTGEDIDLTGKITDFGVCWRGVNTTKLSMVFDNTFLGADIPAAE